MRILIIIFLFTPLTVLADTKSALEYYSSENYEKAYNEFFTVVQQTEDAESYYWLGIMYQKGQFVEQHDFTALLNFEKAGYLGHVDAMREAIRYHLNGWGTLPNNALAAFWLKLSAEGDPKYAAQFKRFYDRLTTLERIEYEKKLEKYQN